MLTPPRPPRWRPPAGAVVALLLLLLTAAAAAGCAGPHDSAAGSGRLRVVAAESFLADIAQNVAGDRFTVGTLIPPGSDPHTYQPTPRDLTDVARADLVIVNGGGLEGSLLDTVKQTGGTATVVDASAGIPSRTPQPGEPPLESGGTDPHFWLDPVLVEKYAATIAAAYSAADPAGKAVYAANEKAYVAKLRRLDAWIKAQVATIPAGRRLLVMNHASHGYFADRYGFRIVGTVIPSATTGESPTAKQLSDLTAAIRSSGAKAIFVESDENPQLARQIGAETGVTVVTDLLDHSLSAPDGPAPTYIDMMRFDTRRIVEALR